MNSAETVLFAGTRHGRRSRDRRDSIRAARSSAGAAGETTHPHAPDRDPCGGVVPVVTPDVPDMPWRMESGVKVFDIGVGHVRTEFIPGRVVDAWGFNGSVPGPTIQVNEGDRVRLIVENRLPEPFSMHWHGLEIPVEMDGMPGISQDAIAPGGRFTYEFTLQAERHVLLPLAHGDAGDDGADRPLHHPSAPRARAARRSRLRHRPAGAGRSFRTTRFRTRWRWSSTG